MAISLETINVGVENQATGSDSLFTAFTKIKNNFSTISNTASQYTNFIGSNGISTSNNPTSGVVTIVNTGVISITPGSGLTASASNGNITISVSGYANGELVAGVTNVGISSNTLTVSNTPVISNGVMTVDLATVGTVTPGEYVAATVTVDEFGRVTAIANTLSSGTVTSVEFVPGVGIELDGTNPIIDSGSITITNSGVTRLNSGPGIELSGRTGEITVSATNPNPGTVTSVAVTSNTLTITGGPVTSTGTINIELPESDTMTGNFTAGNITSSSALRVLGNATIDGNVFANSIAPISGNLLISANANISGNLLLTGNLVPNSGSLVASGNVSVTGNLTSAGNLIASANVSVTGNLSANNITSTRSLTVGNTTQGNITTYNLFAGNTVTISNTGYLLMNTLSDNSKFIGFQAPSTISGSYILWQLPDTDGSANSFLSTNGSGSMSFRQPASSSAPLTASSAGTTGQIAFDSTHIYVCIATNSWIRADAAAW